MRFAISYLSLFIYLIAGLGMASALPQEQACSKPGKVYELKSCALEGNSLWLGGSVSEIVGPWEQPMFGNGFLTHLREDGTVLWEKEFGTPKGGDSVELVVTSNSKVFLAGYAACDLEAAWEGHPEVDWSKEFFLARLDAQGRLETSVRLSADGDSSRATEPYFQGVSLTASADGHLYLGARVRGRFGDLNTIADEYGRALLLHFDSDLKLLDTVVLPGNSLQCLSIFQGRLLGAGIKDAAPGHEMGPALQKPALWDLSEPSAPKLLWEGPSAENSRCLQLDNHLLFSSNDADGAWELDIESLSLLAPLPPGVTVASSPPDPEVPGRWSGGYRAQQWLEAPSTVLWHVVDGLWKQALVQELMQWERVQFLLPSREALLVLGTAGGELPGEKRWCYRRVPWPNPTP